MMSFLRIFFKNLSIESSDVFGMNTIETAPILMLNADCCDEILKHLSLKDLHSYGQTYIQSPTKNHRQLLAIKAIKQ